MLKYLGGPPWLTKSSNTPVTALNKQKSQFLIIQFVAVSVTKCKISSKGWITVSPFAKAAFLKDMTKSLFHSYLSSPQTSIYLKKMIQVAFTALWRWLCSLPIVSELIFQLMGIPVAAKFYLANFGRQDSVIVRVAGRKTLLTCNYETSKRVFKTNGHNYTSRQAYFLTLGWKPMLQQCQETSLIFIKNEQIFRVAKRVSFL